jgi:hypothetical protein
MAAEIDQPGGKLKRTFAAASAAMARPAGCTQRGDVRVISSKLLPRPVRMSKGGSLLIKVTGKTKPGKYEIVLLCEDKHNQPDSVDMKRSGSTKSSALSSSRANPPCQRLSSPM